MAFHDVLFPEGISWGAEGGPEFMTRIVTTGSGHERRNVQWDVPRGRWNVAQGVKTREEAMELREFFYERRGKAFPFRYKDWFDYRAADELMGVGDGTAITYRLYRTYGDPLSGNAYYRRILLPVDNTVYTNANAFEITLDDVPLDSLEYTVNWSKGLVTFVTAPATDVVVRWSGEFHCACRFDTDFFNPVLVDHDYIDWPDIPVLELRPEEFLAEDEL